MKAEIQVTPPSEPVYSLSLTGLNRKDMLFLYSIFGNINGEYDGPRTVADEICAKMNRALKFSEAPPLKVLVRPSYTLITAPSYSEIK